MRNMSHYIRYVRFDTSMSHLNSEVARLARKYYHNLCLPQTKQWARF